MNHFDVVVIGGGPAGICAALASARNGAKTLLLTDRPVLGGNSSSEVRVWTRGAVGGGNLFSEEMGIWGELKLTNLFRNPTGNVLAWDDVLLDAVLRQDNLTLLLNTLATKVDVTDDNITSIQAVGTRTEKEYSISASMYIDCTGDGVIAKQAGLPFHTGRESKQIFMESLATQQDDPHGQGCSILIQTKRMGTPVPYTAPDYAYSLDKVKSLIGRGGRSLYADMQGSDCWWFEYGGQLDVIADDQAITMELRAIALGIWNYIKNSGEYDADDLQLEWIGHYPGRRSSRRIMGKHVLTQKDICEQPTMQQAVAFGGWYMDNHPSAGLLSDDEHCEQRVVHCYGIPLGCLYNTAVNNLMFAGRCASMSYVAFTSVRVMNTCALMGQAAGTAAAICTQNNITPGMLEDEHFHLLHSALYFQDALLTPAEEAKWLRADSVTATSQMLPTSVETKDRLPITQDTFVTYPSIENQHGTMCLESSEDTVLHYSIHHDPLPSRRMDLPDTTSTESIALNKGLQFIQLPMAGQSFVTLRFRPNPHVSIVGGTPLPGVLAGYAWEAELFNPHIQLSDESHYQPGNVQDGYLRPYNGVRAWVTSRSDQDDTSITLHWANPVEIGSLLIIFDPELSSELSSSWLASWDKSHHYAARKAMPSHLVRSYQLVAQTENGQTVILSEENNHQRRRFHTFPKVKCSSLALHINATYGDAAVVYALLPNIEYDR